MMRKALIGITLLPMLAGAAVAEQYDFFDLARYPDGGKLKQWVDLYKVKEAGGKPQEYARRVVQWWPRKGVDSADVREGMIAREWTLVPDFFDQDNPPEPKLDWQTFEYDKLDMPVGVGDHYVRQIEGYLLPQADGDYTFKIAADDGGALFLSTDESRDNVRMICYSFAYSHRNEFTKWPGQISKPIALKKGRKYYYEAVQKDDNATDNLMVVWETATMDQDVPGGSAVSTLDGRVGKVIEKRAFLKEGQELPTTKIRSPLQVRRFKAHLIAFEGLGNDLGAPGKEQDLHEPGVLLRMPDGSRQTFAHGSFCREDREYIYRIYQKEMARIKGAIDKTVYTVKPEILAKFPGGTTAGQPGSWLKQSEHLVIPSGSQGNSPWLGIKDPEAGARYRALVFSSYENFYAWLEYGGHLMPYWDRKEKYKFEGRVGGTILNGYEKVGSGPGGGYGGNGLAPEVMPGGGFAHEYGHGFPIQWNGQFSGEIIAQHMMCVVDGGRVSGFNNSISNPWRNCLHGSYDTTLFFRALGYDPNWGNLVVAALPKAADEVGFYQTMARIGQQRGVFKDGIRGVGDTVGDYAARMPEFDWPIRDYAREEFFAAQRNYLEPLAPEQGIYRIPWDEAPEPFGANLVRLVPDGDGKHIEVDFQGYHDPAIYSDWRACIVAVDKDDKCRYSDLWNKGVMRMDRQAGDQRYWLTVAATPTALLKHGIGWTLYQGNFAPRYPWQVTLKGAVPGAPQRTRLDLNDVYGIYGNIWIKGFVPVVPNTVEARRFLTEAQAFLNKADAALPKAPYSQRLAYANNTRFAREAISSSTCVQHPNGGGWVAATAKVAPTAYIGPNARVLGNAQVLDQAIVENDAVITGNAVVSGHARVSGQAVIDKDTKMGGYQRSWKSLELRIKTGEEAPDLPARGNEGLDPNGLWANYAMDQAEAVMLEDYYRSKDDALVFNGYLYGNPKLVVDDKRRGFAFDGKTQYAELNRQIADLGEITVDMAVKWQGDGEHTLLDCGSGMDNHFMLTTGGKLAFTAVVDGRKVAAVTSSESLKKDTWTRVRLEIDGKKIALWMDDKPVGEKASDFRAAQVFQPGKARRNFIAAALDGSDKFNGIFDYVTVYHMVHGGGFANLPAPYHDAPRRPEKGFVLDTYKSLSMSPEAQADMKKRYSDQAMAIWSSRGAEGVVYLTDLKLSVPEYVQAVAKAKEFEKWQKDTEDKLKKDYSASKDGAPKKTEIDRISAELKDVVEKISVLGKKEREQKPKEKPQAETAGTADQAPGKLSADAQSLQTEVAALEQELAALKALEKQARDAVDAMPETSKAREEIARLKEQIKPLEGDASKKFKEAVGSDEMLKKMKVAAEHLNYSRDFWRVVRACQGCMGKEGREAVIKNEIIARDPEYRKWAEAADRISQLERDAKYRLPEYLLHHGDHPLLLEEVKESERKLKDGQKRLEIGIRDANRKVAETGDMAVSELDALKGRKASLETAKRDLEAEIKKGEKAYVDENMIKAGLNVKTAENDERLKAAGSVVSRKYPLEYSVLCSFIRQNFHGFYNAPISGYIGQHAQMLAGGVVRDNLESVARIEEAFAPENWLTGVDQWDGRTPWEKVGSIKDLPLTQKWLKRVGQVGK